MFNALSVDDECWDNDQAEWNHRGQNTCTLNNDTTYVISPLPHSSVAISMQCTLCITALRSIRILNTEVIAQAIIWQSAKVTVPQTSLKSRAVALNKCIQEVPSGI